MDDQTKHAVGTVLHAIRRNSSYHARLEIERIVDRCRADPKRLEPFGFKVYSQNDEDGIIEEIFRRLGVGAGAFAEIGVESGLQSNSLYLLHKGWRGVWFEANADQVKAAREKFESLVTAQRLAIGLTFATAENVNQLLEHRGLPAFDFLSIDVVGRKLDRSAERRHGGRRVAGTQPFRAGAWSDLEARAIAITREWPHAAIGWKALGLALRCRTASLSRRRSARTRAARRGRGLI